MEASKGSNQRSHGEPKSMIDDEVKKAHEDQAHDNHGDRSSKTKTSSTTMHSDLFWAAAKGEIEAFKENKAGHDLSQLVTPDKNTVLHVHVTASTTDETHFVEEILKLCPPLLLQRNAAEETPLHMAARNGHLRIVEFLIARSQRQPADLESGDESGTVKKMLRAVSKENDTALHEAVRFRHLKVVRLLTKEDPDFSHPANLEGETPLYMAAERGYSECVQEILENCASPGGGGPNGRTVLHVATIRKDEELTRKILLKLGNLTNKADQVGECVHEILDTCALPDHVAVPIREEKTRKILSKLGNLTDKADQVGGRVPLHYAAHLECTELVKLLLEADKHSAYMKDDNGMTALHIAARNGSVEIMRLIVERCPDSCELVDKKGRNVLHFAVESRNVTALRVILDNPAHSNLLNRKDNDGNTAFLHIVNLDWDRSILDSSFTNAEFNYPIIEAFLSNSRVDNMAFNKENKNILDMVSSDEEMDPMNKKFYQRTFEKKGIRSGRRLLNPKTGNENDDTQSKDMFDIDNVRESTLVAATLIATVTFAAGFTLPGGYVSDEGPLKGTAVLRENAAFRAFMITDTLAMFLSAASVFINLCVLWQPRKQMALVYVKYSSLLTTLAMMMMVIAFVTGTYAVLAPSTPLAVATCVIGLCFFYICLPVYGLIDKFMQ